MGGDTKTMNLPSISQEFQVTECDAIGLKDKGRKTASSFLLITITPCWTSPCMSNFSFLFDRERYRGTVLEEVSLGAHDASFNKCSPIANNVPCSDLGPGYLVDNASLPLGSSWYSLVV